MRVIFQLFFLFSRNVAIEIDAAQQGKDQRHSQQTEHLEVDPHLLRQVEGHIEIEQATDGKEADPAEIDLVPDCIGCLQLLGQHLFDQVFAKAVAADEQTQCETSTLMTVTFHLMKVSSWKKTVRPPKKPTSRKVKSCIFSTLR